MAFEHMHGIGRGLWDEVKGHCTLFGPRSVNALPGYKPEPMARGNGLEPARSEQNHARVTALAVMSLRHQTEPCFEKSFSQ